MRTNLCRSAFPHGVQRAALGFVAPLAAILLALGIASPQRAQADEGAKYTALIKDAKTQTGLIKTHQKEGKVYLEIASGNMNKDYIVAISIARGIAQGSLLGGMTWGFGDDWLWQFRKVDDDIQIVRRNVRFTRQGRLARGEGRQAGLHRQRAVSPCRSRPRAQWRRLRDRSHAGLHERPAADFQRPAGLLVLVVAQSTWAAVKALRGERRAGGRGHLRLRRQARDRHRAR